VNQAGRKNVNVTVPKARRNHKSFTVDNGGIAGSFDRGSGSNFGNATIVDQDRSLLDRAVTGGGINPGTNQNNIRSEACANAEERQQNG
jgi:hypothetical protein